jgi:AraC family transcriptional regulator
LRVAIADSPEIDWDAPCGLDRAEPHPIAFAPQSRIVADSSDLGWRDAFASITSRRAWSGRLAPLPHLGLGYCLRGQNRIARQIDGEAAARMVDFQARQIALLPSHACAQFRVWGDADVLVVYLRGGMVRAVADRMFGASNRPLHFAPAMAFGDPLLEQICLTFADALTQGLPARYVDQLAESAAAHCLVRYPLEGARALAPAPPPLARVAAHVDANLDGELSVEALAEAAGVTLSALKRAFALAGETPKQWVMQRRLARAREWLADTDLPLAEIALRAGFSSQSHLCWLFKREIGRTPNSFRRAASQKTRKR